MTEFPPKSPESVLDYRIDWTRWLAGDIISNGQWTVPPGLTVVNQIDSPTGSVIWLSGGVDGVNYIIEHQVQTTGGRVDKRNMLLPVRRR